MSWDSETSAKIREAKDLIQKARKLLMESQLTDNWDDLKDIYQDKVALSIQRLRDMYNDL